jgi:hypothetical protein
MAKQEIPDQDGPISNANEKSALRFDHYFPNFRKQKGKISKIDENRRKIKIKKGTYAVNNLFITHITLWYQISNYSGEQNITKSCLSGGSFLKSM